MSVNGNNIRSNNFYLDGGQNTSQYRNSGNQSPNPDAVAEFHLITNSVTLAALFTRIVDRPCPRRRVFSR
jgi:hypothetical protein